MDTWSAVLDEMERRLAAAGGAMDAGEYGFEAVAIPASLGPLPAVYRDRAGRLYQATLDAEARVEEAMTAVRDQLGRRSSLNVNRPLPAYVDRRA